MGTRVQKELDIADALTRLAARVDTPGKGGSSSPILQPAATEATEPVVFSGHLCKPDRHVSGLVAAHPRGRGFG
ncbi:MAG: hypothetical protein WAO98_02815 [Alphaproteobacteria bacterium]